MSKGESYLFKNTMGNGKALIEEVQRNGEKISPEKVVLITRTPENKIVWLEIGTQKSGLQHIIKEHGAQFNGKGISNKDIPNYILEAIHQGVIVGTQGKRNPRTIYEFVYNNVKQQIAIQVSSNGYIVGANLKSIR